MRKAVILLLAIAAIISGCKKQEPVNRSAWTEDRFASQFKDLAQIANLRQITDMQKDMEPFFSLSGDRICFRRIVTPNPKDTSGGGIEARAGMFSYDYRNNQLFLLEKAPDAPDPYQGYVPADSLPALLGETSEIGYRTPYGLIFSTSGASFGIYKAQGESIIQLTYGIEPSYLQVVSPDRRYVVFNYGKSFYRLVVLDLATGEFYSMPRSSVDIQLYEIWPQFSPDSKYLVFVVSHDVFSAKKEEEDIPLGDVWLAEFKAN
jgi:hypothetical protein